VVLKSILLFSSPEVRIRHLEWSTKKCNGAYRLTKLRDEIFLAIPCDVCSLVAILFAKEQALPVPVVYKRRCYWGRRHNNEIDWL
jgi:hypothetical protein